MTIFCAVAELRSIAAAARRFSVTASGITQSIRRLEKELSWQGQYDDSIVLREIGDYRRQTYVYSPLYAPPPAYIKLFISTLAETFPTDK